MQATLRAGIAAVREGDRANGRALLMRVLEADERVAPAWLWLSAAVDDPADQLVALENVLALNPGHPQAMAGAETLRRQLGLALPEPAVVRVAPAQPKEMAAGAAQTPAPQHPPGAAIREPSPPTAPAYAFAAADPEDDPYQCAYCGRPTEAEDTRCPQCRRSLLRSGRWTGGGHLYVILILAGLQTQSAVVQAAAAYGHEYFPHFASLLPRDDIWAANLIVPSLARAVLWLGLVLILLTRTPYPFRLTLIGTAADLAWIAAAVRLGYMGKELATANALFAGPILLLALLAVIVELQERVRLKVVLDKNIQSALQFERRAQAYARHGMWALAALHWRRATSLQPRNPRYYRALGLANARLGRLEAARRAWRSGAEVAPNDPDFARRLRQ
jgi:hypothetical protein